ncbi:MAG: hypothetical protein ACRC62_34910 [Microcoleus sp.]
MVQQGRSLGWCRTVSVRSWTVTRDDRTRLPGGSPSPTALALQP